MLETLELMKSRAVSGVSALNSTTASCAPRVDQVPCTSIPLVGVLVSFLSWLETARVRGASHRIKQMYPCFDICNSSLAARDSLEYGSRVVGLVVTAETISL
jgi:hypothetical protein